MVVEHWVNILWNRYETQSSLCLALEKERKVLAEDRMRVAESAPDFEVR